MKEIRNFNDLLCIEPYGDYYLTHDIDCAGAEITHLVGDFKGTINGKGFAIKNLTIKEEDIWTDGQLIALFYTMSNACVKNLRLENISLSIAPSDYSPSVALLCVKANNSTIENLTVNPSSAITNNIPLVYEANNCSFANIQLKSPIELKLY